MNAAVAIARKIDTDPKPSWLYDSFFAACFFMTSGIYGWFGRCRAHSLFSFIIDKRLKDTGAPAGSNNIPMY